MVDHAHPAGAERSARNRPFDAGWLLSVYVGLLILVPAPLKVPALGSAGHPATILSLGAFAWWCWHRVNRSERVSETRQPVRLAALVLIIATLVAYVHAMFKPIAYDEISPADAGLLRILGGLGLVLTATDGLASAGRIVTVIRRLITLVAAVSVIAILQRLTGRIWVDQITIPGLGTTVGALDLGSRAGLVRPTGTATHSIEFGAVLATTLPIALTMVRLQRERTRWAIFAALIALALLLALSRTALVSVAIGLVVLLAGWPRRARLVAMLGGACILLFSFLFVPGLMGTIRGMFQFVGDDPSVQSRTSSYALAEEFVAASPWVGRGFGTFLPKYWILDNFYLQLLIEMGIVGLLSMAVLFATATWSALRASKMLRLQADSELARGCAASVTAASVSLLFFDGLSFPQSAGLLFLMVGLCGAWYRIASNEAVRPHPECSEV